MKVGIITFHWADNFGAVLQTYALSKFINEFLHNCKAEVVDYICKDCEKAYRPFVFKNNDIKGTVKGVLRGIKNFPFWLKSHNGFKEFRKLIPFSKHYSKFQLFNSENDYDVWITGSDQVWNANIVGKDIDIYDLSFVNTKKKCSYAASSGELGENLNDFQKKMIEDISNLNDISVREKTTQHYLASKLGKNVELVLDPTFLIDRNEWAQLAGNKRMYQKDYLFIYFISFDRLLLETAEKIANAMDLDIIVCGYSKKLKGKAIQYKAASPFEFLNLLMNAKFVLASSFHATAFSIIFEKQFLALIPPYASNRVVDLCESFGLEKRVIHSNITSNDVLDEVIDYDEIRNLITDSRIRSIDFLNSILKTY